jgi:ATP-dependent DNA helicase PIF1
MTPTEPATIDPYVMDNYYSATELKHRRWTNTAIVKFAGPPDRTAPNPCYETGAPMRFWSRERITHIEETPEFVLWKAGSDKRRITRETPIETEFLTGSAGTGKTYEVQARCAADPEGVVLAATTGIAAVNLGPGVTTLHSLLGGFRNIQALIDAYHSGRLQRNIRKLVDEGLRELIVDEVSMLCAPALDTLYNGFHDVAQGKGHPQIKVILVGDFCQLPPIPDREVPGSDRYAFEGECWEKSFSPYTKRLTHIWRQDNVDFILALQAARRGDGEQALAYLQRAGVRFERALNTAFDGTTLCSTNDVTDAYNERRLLLLPGDNSHVPFVPSTRWSLNGYPPPGEWKNIPEKFTFKLGMFVMILANGPHLAWSNGDCGTITGTIGNQFIVRLKRNGSEVLIGKITRISTTRTKPPVADGDVISMSCEEEYNDATWENDEPPRQVVMLREPRPAWVTGWIRYFPLRLAYATTIHKSQGLSLDTVQFDLSSGFLSEPAMMYVALSRCKTPDGLVLVGRPEQVVQKTNVDPRVIEWL